MHRTLNLVEKEAVLHIFLIMVTMKRELYEIGNRYNLPVDTGRKLNVHMTFNFRPVSVGFNAEHFFQENLGNTNGLSCTFLKIGKKYSYFGKEKS